ncbi:MAG: SLATT domain-containing protein [Bradyrhizobiaceae bacterium]|nr:SLATT domain-containing protein [Bradyrhizobiaceae bacterium]
MRPELLSEYRNEAKRIAEDALHSAKSHYNAATRWRSIHLWIGIPNVIAAALAGVSAFKGSDILAGSLAVTVAAITAVSTFLNPNEWTLSHRRCAGEYLTLRNRARIFLNIVTKSDRSDDDIQAVFEELVVKRDDLNASSPQIPDWAYNKAKIGIKNGESDYSE